MMAIRFSEEIVRLLRFQPREQYRAIAALDVLARSFQPKTPYDATALDQAIFGAKIVLAKNGKTAKKGSVAHSDERLHF